MARLKTARSLPETEAAANAQLQEFRRTTSLEQFRGADRIQLRLLPGNRGWAGAVASFRTPLLMLLMLVAIVLLIACANVASMLLARANARRRELAVRISIGAGRSRLVRQMLAESTLLSLLGGALGIAIAIWGGPLLVWFLPQGHVGIFVDLRPDVRTLGFTFALSLLTSVLFGLVPAVHTTHCELASTLKSDSTASIGEGTSAAFRKAFVLLQVAFSVVLLVAAGLFVRILSDLRPNSYHAPGRVLLFTIKPQPEIYTPERVRLLTLELVRRVSSLPDVQFAALAETGPLASRQSTNTVRVPGQEPIRCSSDDVTPGFFDTIGVRLIAGRDFNAADTPDSNRVAVINQTLARTLFKDESAIGRIIALPAVRNQHRRYEVIGIAADHKYHDLRIAPAPGVWLAYQTYPPYMPTLHVRIASSNTVEAIAAVRREFDAVDKGFPFFNIKTLELRIEDALARERMVAGLSAGFGTLALVLAAVGLYGILAYVVTRRTREIGIRMALGSGTGAILWLVGREAVSLVAGGMAAGGAIALLAARLLRQYLFGISGVDLSMLLMASGLILVIALIAITIPAWRACRVDPLVALRNE